jgi:hypothetical protein
MSPLVHSSCILLLFCIHTSWAQEVTKLPPFPSARNIRPTIDAHVSKLDSVFVYSYTVRNDTRAAQSINGIMIEIGECSAYLYLMPTNWRPGIYRHHSLRVWSWGSMDDADDIHPGNSNRQLGFTSSGLPGIMVARIRGNNRQELIDSTGAEPEYDMTDADIYHNCVFRQTVAPRVVPKSTSTTLLLDTLLAYVLQARDLGWIASKRSAEKYFHLFAAIRSDSIQANVGSLSSQCDTILRFVQDDVGTEISSEAYALIYFNTLYLKERLHSGN